MDSTVSNKKIVRTKSFEIFDEINWAFTGAVILGHLLSIHGLMHIWGTRWQTLVYLFSVVAFVQIGAITGAHRLWSHKSFKAALPLRIFFMACQSVSCQGPIYIWARWHRMHHKHSDTPGDPQNPSRGYFFAHIGWSLMYDHQKFQRNAEGEIDSSDLEADGVVMWQYRNYIWFLAIVFSATVLFPGWMGWDSFINSMTIMSLAVILEVHMLGFINSLGHGIIGARPFDRFIRPSQILLLDMLTGEGDHNYHHTFPWDYKSSAYLSLLNFPAHSIHFFKWMGLAYDLRSASPELIYQRAQRTGDGSFMRNNS